MMQSFFQSLSGIATGGTTPPVVQTPISTRPRVMIISGQSNARGQETQSSISSEYPHLIPVLSNRKIWNGTSFADIEIDINTNWPAPNTRFGVELNYSYLINNFWGNNYPDYIIKIAWNATEIEAWLSGGIYRNTFINWVTNALNAISIDSNNYSCVFYWDQGENNAELSDDPALYEGLFTQMITDFRTTLNVRKLPVILRKMRSDNNGHPQINAIIEQQNNIIQSVPDTYLMESLDISDFDGVHFGGVGQCQLGKRLMEKAIYLFD